MDELRKYFDELYDSPSGREESASALHKVESRLGIRRRRSWIPVCAAAVAAAAVAFVLIIFANGYSSPASWQELRVPEGQTAQLTLDDGSTLVLNGGTRVTYPSTFCEDSRTIFLDGEVLADIAKDSDRPFVICSGELSVKVHGTRFDFKSYDEMSNAELYLMEGSVSLDFGRGSEIMMIPGDFAQYDKSNGNVSLAHGAQNEHRAFNEGKCLCFRDLKLSDIAVELRKNFGVKIVLASPELADKRFFAYFTNGESLDEILSSFNSDGSMIITKNDGTVILSRK